MRITVIGIVIGICWWIAPAMAQEPVRTTTKAQVRQTPAKEATTVRKPPATKVQTDAAQAKPVERVIQVPDRKVSPVRAKDPGNEGRAVPARAAQVAARPVAPVKSSSVELMIKDGYQAQQTGRYESALKLYGDVKAAPQASPSKKAEAAIQSAVVLESWAAADTTKKARLPEAVASYNEAIRVGEPVQQQKARNNLAVLHLREGKVKDAVQVFRQTDFRSVEPALRHVYFYNFGRALESDAGLPEALSQYETALQHQPDYQPAVEGAFRILHQMQPPPVERAAKLATLLVAKGQAEQAAGQVWKALGKWGGEASAQHLLAALIRSYAALSLDPPKFRETESRKLSELAGGSAPLRAPVADIRQAYLSRHEPVFNQQALSKFPSWRDPDWKSESFSVLLKSIADFHAGQGSPGDAASLYYTAWALDPNNSDAALGAASILRKHRELDRNGAFFAEFLESLFMQKGRAYQQRDDRTILRMHTILGSVFEQDGRWGNEDDIQGATFHWKRALEAEARLRAKNPGLSPSPGLHQHLAECYRRSGRGKAAFEQYLSAAEEFLALHQTSSAAEAHRKAAELAGVAGGDGQQRLQEVLLAIQKQQSSP